MRGWLRVQTRISKAKDAKPNTQQNKTRSEILSRIEWTPFTQQNSTFRCAICVKLLLIVSYHIEFYLFSFANRSQITVATAPSSFVLMLGIIQQCPNLLSQSILWQGLVSSCKDFTSQFYNRLGKVKCVVYGWWILDVLVENFRTVGKLQLIAMKPVSKCLIIILYCLLFDHFRTYSHLSQSVLLGFLSCFFGSCVDFHCGSNSVFYISGRPFDVEQFA